MTHSYSDFISTQSTRNDIQDNERHREENARNERNRQYAADNIRYFESLLLIEKEIAADQIVDQEPHPESATTVTSDFLVKERIKDLLHNAIELRDTPAMRKYVALLSSAASRENQIQFSNERLAQFSNERLAENAENAERKESKTENKENRITRRKKQEKKRHISSEDFLQPPPAITINRLETNPLPSRESQSSELSSVSKSHDKRTFSKSEKSAKIARTTSDRAKEKSQIQSLNLERNAELNRETNPPPRRETQSSERAGVKFRDKQISSKSKKNDSLPQRGASIDRTRNLFGNQAKQTQLIRKNTNISRDSTKRIKNENKDNAKEDRIDERKNVTPNPSVNPFNGNQALLQDMPEDTSISGKSNMLAETMTNLFQDPGEMVNQLWAAGEKGKSIQLRVDKLQGTTITLSSQPQGGVAINIHTASQAAFAIIEKNIQIIRQFFSNNLPFRPLQLKVSFASGEKRSPQNEDEETAEMNAYATGNNKNEIRLSDNMA